MADDAPTTSPTDDDTAVDTVEDTAADTVAVTVTEPAVAIEVDGREHRARPGQLVIDACADAGAYVPHFCYHPRMTPVGMCRQCLVEVEGPRGPMMVVSCMTPVADGQIVRTNTEQVKRAQEGVLELLLANHPLDCPVCDKGGECPLQDQAFSHGPGESRYVEQKRNYEKPIPISDLVYLDRERCILCDRCTRFADEVAGDKLIHFISRGNDTQVMTFPDEPFASYFSGNTVQICPVGALTARPYRFKARPWDLEQLESTCTTCSVGCRTVVQSSRDELLRYQGVDSEPVNWGWLCDRGRFGFEAINSAERLGTPLIAQDGQLVETNWSTALANATAMVNDALAAGGPDSIAIIGGARGTNEDAWMWARLADSLGIARRDPQVGDGLEAALVDLPRATIAAAANAPTVILLGPDLKEELPVLYLRLRDAAQKRRSRLIEFAPMASGLSTYCWKSIRYEPGTAAAVVAETLADPEIAAQLRSGEVVVVAGRTNLAESPALITEALAEVFAAAPTATVLPAVRRGNVMGALSVGLRPGDETADAMASLRRAAQGGIELLILLGADPLADCPDGDLARRALAGARRIISIDTFLSDSSRHADLVLAAAAYGEKAGTTTNLEGRVTNVVAKVTVTGTARPDWMIAAELAARLGHDHGIASVDEVSAAIARSVAGYGDITPAHRSARRGTARAQTAKDGVLTATPAPGNAFAGRSRTAVAVRNNYDFRLVVSRKLYDAAVQTAASPSLAPLAPGAQIVVNPAALEQLGITEGAEVRVIGPRATVVLPIRADDAVPRGIAWSPFNQPGVRIADVIDAELPVTDIRIERL